MRKRTIEEVRNVIEEEGIGYAITSYMSADSIADPKLSKLWADAAALLERIRIYVADNADSEAP